MYQCGLLLFRPEVSFSERKNIGEGFGVAPAHYRGIVLGEGLSRRF